MLLGKTQTDLLFIRGVIYVVAYPGLVGLVYFLAVLAIGGADASGHPFSVIVEVVGAIEILWYLLWFLPYRAHLNTLPAVQMEPLSPTQRRNLFQRLLELTPDLDLCVRKWLCNAHHDDIRRENVKTWLLEAFFDRNGPPGPDNIELEDYVTALETCAEMPIKPGKGDAEALRPRLDEMKMAHRSLLHYVIVGLFDLYTTFTLISMNFRFYRQKRRNFIKNFPFRPMTLLSTVVSPAPNISYFYRPHMSLSHRPIFFIHGAGIGLYPYLYWLRHIPKDVGVAAVELMPISNRLTNDMPTTAELVSAFLAIIQEHQLTDIVFIAHSYGTLFTGPLLRHHVIGPLLSRVVLVDPLSLLSHLPDTLYNTLHRPPKSAADLQIKWAIAQDPGIAFTLGRRFCWREYLLWREDMQSELRNRRTTIVVSAEDSVINARAVASYAYYGDAHYADGDEEEWQMATRAWSGMAEIELLWMETLDHGQVFTSRGAYGALTKLEQVIDTYCNRESKPFGSVEHVGNARL